MDRQSGRSRTSITVGGWGAAVASRLLSFSHRAGAVTLGVGSCCCSCSQAEISSCSHLLLGTFLIYDNPQDDHKLALIV